MTQSIVHDGRAPAEIAYDNLRSGAAYIKPAAGSCPACAEVTALGAAYCDACGHPVAPANPSPLLVNLIGWAEEQIAAEQIAPVSQDDQLTSLLTDMYGDERAVAAWIDRQRPAILDWETARQQALAEWEGEVKIRDDGQMRRYPELPMVEIGRATDGTPIYGDFDNDDTPHVVWVEWGSFSICAGDVGFDMGDDEGDKDYHHITLAQWENLKKLVNSGILDQALYFAKAWEAQREEDTDTIASILTECDGGE